MRDEHGPVHRLSFHLHPDRRDYLAGVAGTFTGRWTFTHHGFGGRNDVRGILEADPIAVLRWDGEKSSNPS